MKIKFLNLNIWYGKLLDDVIKFIKKENPDIISLQEVYDGKKMSPKWLNSYSLIKKELNYKYSSFAPAFYVEEKGKRINQGQVILSRYPVINQKIFFYDIPYGKFIFPAKDFSRVPRNLQKIRLNIKGKNLNIFNTQGIWGKDQLDNARRIKMSKKIIGQIRGKKYVILSGDFNVNPQTTTIKNIEKFLRNPFKKKLITTINPKRINKAINERKSILDMVFVSSYIRILNFYCPKVDVSDHMPLIIVFEI